MLHIIQAETSAIDKYLYCTDESNIMIEHFKGNNRSYTIYCIVWREGGERVGRGWGEGGGRVGRGGEKVGRR